MDEMKLSKYYNSVKIYLSMPKDMGFEYMEVILDEMVEDGMSWSEAYETFGAMVDYVVVCEA